MNNKNPYFSQVELLVRILPLVEKYPCFALKGGTAINLFYRNMPRLSVDIDLVYLPIKERGYSLNEISRNLINIGNTIIEEIQDAKIQYSFLNKSEYMNRLIVKVGKVSVKIELSPVLRGTVYEPETRSLSKVAEETFGVLQMSVVSFEDLFAGKMIAALDRQHPRDLFDIKGLLENESISDRLKKAFIVYLISHGRKILEILNPNLLDIEQTFEADFVGMTDVPASLTDLTKARTHLILAVNKMLNDQDKKFLIDFKEGHPDWSYFSVPHIQNLPAVKWKLFNLNRIEVRERQRMVKELKDYLR